MHDMVRDLTIRIANEEAFCSFDDQGRHIPTVDSRRLGVTRKMDFHTLKRNSKLRALLLMTSHSICFNRDIGLAKVKSLRVLDLSHVNLDNICMEDLWSWISSLKRLACLNLRDVANLKEVPYSIGKLWGLQILILAECRSLEKLSASVTTLKKLRVLNVGNCPSLQYLPQGLSRLSNLQELYGSKLAGLTKTEGCHLRELKGLIQLRELQVDIHEESVIEDDELTVLAELKQLRVLSINAENCENIDILQKLDKLSPPPCLEELYLGHYCGEVTPEWINLTSLSQLQYLCIENSRLKHMSPHFWGSDGNDWKVEGLCLKLLPRLQVEWEMVQRVMPLLRYLEVSRCYMLQSFPCNVMTLGYWKKTEEENEDGELEDTVYQEELHAAP
uniref:Putative disease resistance RPP13-like protein 4 n=1 Tax=Davidia involucrata TaxID=16924 RepID=A0A5B7B6R7_DAVIN